MLVFTIAPCNWCVFICAMPAALDIPNLRVRCRGGAGIDLGTTYSCVAAAIDNRVEVIPNELGHRVTPSWGACLSHDVCVCDCVVVCMCAYVAVCGRVHVTVHVCTSAHSPCGDSRSDMLHLRLPVAFTSHGRLVGDSAKNQVASNVANTVYDIKRLMGRSYEDARVELPHLPYAVFERHGRPVIGVQHRGQPQEFAPGAVIRGLECKGHVHASPLQRSVPVFCAQKRSAQPFSAR